MELEAFNIQFYVQDLIKRDAVEIYDLINGKNGYFYICGDVKMAHSVSAVLEEILMDKGKITADEAKQYITTMKVFTNTVIISIYLSLY